MKSRTGCLEGSRIWVVDPDATSRASEFLTRHAALAVGSELRHGGHYRWIAIGGQILTLFIVIASTIARFFLQRCRKPVALTPVMALVILASTTEAYAGDYETRTLEWDSLDRSYLIHLPSGAGNGPLPAGW